MANARSASRTGFFLPARGASDGRSLDFLPERSAAQDFLPENNAAEDRSLDFLSQGRCSLDFLSQGHCSLGVSDKGQKPRKHVDFFMTVVDDNYRETNYADLYTL